MVKPHGPPKRWYERHDYAIDRLVAPWHWTWWWRAWWDVAGPCFRTLIWLGLWDLREGHYYAEGHWTWGTSVYGGQIREIYGFWQYVSGRLYE